MHIGEKREERIAPMRGSRQTQRTKSGAMVSAMDAKYLGPSGHTAGQFHGTFYGLGATVHEVNGIQSRSGQGIEQHAGRSVLGCLGILTIYHHMQMPVHLRVQCLSNGRVTMPQRTHANSTHKVKQTLTLIGFQPSTFSPHDALTQRVWCGHGQTAL